MEVTYLYNSGFLVELEHHLLLFDYYLGNIPKLNPQKSLYVFVSHNHYDHYNPEIYNINHPNITYIIDSTIENKGIQVKPHQTYNIDDLVVKTLYSTDLGVAFVINVENKNIYHGGDLHWWHWSGEPDQDNNYQAVTFKQEINKIKDINFDLLFTALDPRLEETIWWGMDYILKNVTTKYVLPMHFTESTQKMLEAIDNPPLNQYHNIIKIKYEGEEFNLL